MCGRDGIPGLVLGTSQMQIRLVNSRGCESNDALQGTIVGWITPHSSGTSVSLRNI